MPGETLLSVGATYTRTSEVALPTRLSAASSWTVLLSGRRGSSPSAALLCICSSCIQWHNIHLPCAPCRVSRASLLRQTECMNAPHAEEAETGCKLSEGGLMRLAPSLHSMHTLWLKGSAVGSRYPQFTRQLILGRHSLCMYQATLAAPYPDDSSYSLL